MTDGQSTGAMESSGTERLKNMIPSQDELEVGEEYLLPTSLVRSASGGKGERYEAVRIEVVEKHVQVDESTHKASEGYDA